MKLDSELLELSNDIIFIEIGQSGRKVRKMIRIEFLFKSENFDFEHMFSDVLSKFLNITLCQK